MDQPKLTPEERRLLRQIAAYGPTRYVLSYASILLGPIVFAIYGFAKHDPSAIIAAFLILFVVDLWIISHNARNSKLLSAICLRLLALEKDDGERNLANDTIEIADDRSR
jgi:hypothetical protein